MAPPCYITILGTVSAVPTLTRNHSSLAFSLPNGDTWLFDCGEATQLQIQKTGGGVKMGRISRVFITHMHGDHLFGLPALMATRMNGAGGSEDDPRVLSGPTPEDTPPDVEVYGPVGLRRYLRESFKLTYSRLDGFYAVHELHPALPEAPRQPAIPEERYGKELPGRDMYPDADGIWRDITMASGSNKKEGGATAAGPGAKKRGGAAEKEWVINAGPILHTVPSMGFVLVEPPLAGTVPPSYRARLLENAAEFAKLGVKNPLALLSKLSSSDESDEGGGGGGGGGGIDLPDGTKLERPPSKPGRKIVILGDTCDPSPITSAAMDADVLVHEATNAFLKQDELENTKGGYDGLEAWSVSRGHSTPEMAGRFARKIRLGGNARASTSIVASGRDHSRQKAAAPEGKKAGDAATPEGKGCLLLNHFSSRYADPHISEAAASVMEEIRVCGENGYKQHPAPRPESAAEKLATVDLDDSKVEEKEGAPLTNSVDVICTHDCMRLEIRAIK